MASLRLQCGERSQSLLIAWHHDLGADRPSRSARRSPTSGSWTTSARKRRPSVRSPASPSATPWRPTRSTSSRERLNTPGPLRRRQRLVGAARRRRPGQHRGQGQVPLGAGADRRPGRRTTSRSGCCSSHGNLFGRGKQLVLGGRLAARRFGRACSPTAIRRCSAAGSTGSCRAVVQRQVIPEYENSDPSVSSSPTRSIPRDAPLLVRVRARRSASPGCAGVQDPGGWHLEQFTDYSVVGPDYADVPATDTATADDALPATNSGHLGVGASI